MDGKVVIDGASGALGSVVAEAALARARGWRPRPRGIAGTANGEPDRTRRRWIFPLPPESRKGNRRTSWRISAGSMRR